MLRGIHLPVLIRFRDILRHRVADIHNAFKSAITQHQYQGRYVCVYPIKVNQQRQVVEEVLDFGREYGFGLEAGSKPELLAVAAQAYNDTPIICNGFKDAEFIEMAMLAQKIGRNVIPVVEKYTELGLILKYAEKVGVRPADRDAGQARGPRRRTLAGFRRLPLEVRPDRRRGAPRPRRAALARAWRTASSSCTSTSAARFRTSGSSRARSTRRPASTSSWSRPARASSSSTSAAASGSTTTARRPTSNRASTTRSRNTPTTSSTTSRRCATTPA